jgi:hypothetical protein
MNSQNYYSRVRNKQTNLRFIILMNFAVVINVVGGVCLRETSAMFLCSCSSRKDKNWGAVFFLFSFLFFSFLFFSFLFLRLLGEELLVTSVFQLVYLLRNGWHLGLRVLSGSLSSCGQQTSTRKTLNYAIAIEVEVEASGYCCINNVFTKHPSLITVYQYLKGKIGIVAEYVVRRF